MLILALDFILSGIEPSSRRKGIAREALSLLIDYASSDPTPSRSNSPTSDSTSPLPIRLDNFIAKISLDNVASRKLFKSLGFKEGKVREIWREVELNLNSENADSIVKTRPLKIFEWKMES